LIDAMMAPFQIINPMNPTQIRPMQTVGFIFSKVPWTP